MRSRLRLIAVLAVAASATVTLAPAALASEISVEEQQFVYELNVARADPAAYAAAHLSGSLAALVASFSPMPPLAVSETVGVAAQWRTDDMAHRCYFLHQNGDNGPREALEYAGYVWSYWAENIGHGYLGAISLLNGFLESPRGHRESVMDVNEDGSARSYPAREVGVGFVGGNGTCRYRNIWTVLLTRPRPDRTFVTGVVYADGNGNGRMDLGEGIEGATVRIGASSTLSNAGGGWSIPVPSGTHTVVVESGSEVLTRTAAVGASNAWVEIVVGGGGLPDPCPDGRSCDGAVFVDGAGRWHRWSSLGSASPSEVFYFGDPGDVAFAGDWDCDGVATPGLYRQSDGFVYLRNANSEGVADVTFYFGNPGDVPIAGDFDGDGCDTVSVYRPAEGRVYVVNELGGDGGGLGPAEYDYYFGNPGDAPFAGDFDGDGVDTVGLHRASTGLVYFRNVHSAGPADAEFVYGDPADRVFAGDWDGDGIDSVAAYRPATATLYVKLANAAGNADLTLLVGDFVAAARS